MFTTQCLLAALRSEIVLLLILQFRNSNTPSRLCLEETLTHESAGPDSAKKIPAQTIGSVGVARQLRIGYMQAQPC